MSETPSTPQLPPPTYRRRKMCCCARCRCRGLMGPVVLITLGVLFLIPQFIDRVGFGDLWPVILIVVGAMKLLESSASTEGHVG